MNIAAPAKAAIQADWPNAIYRTLKAHGVAQISYVPDAGHSRLIELSHAEIRRQVLTRGVRLNDLLGKRFRVGEVEAVGAEWCEPCNHIEKLTYDGVTLTNLHNYRAQSGLATITGSPGSNPANASL